MIIENANEKDRDWFKRIEDMVKEDSMSLNYIKFYKPANVVAGIESHSRRVTRGVIIKN
jgi:hypothetical protein